MNENLEHYKKTLKDLKQKKLKLEQKETKKRKRRLKRLKESQARQLEKFNNKYKGKKGVTEKRKRLKEKQRNKYKERVKRYNIEVKNLLEDISKDIEIYINLVKGLGKNNNQFLDNYTIFSNMMSAFTNELESVLESTLRADELAFTITNVRTLVNSVDKEKMNSDKDFYNYFKYLAVDRIEDSDLILSVMFGDGTQLEENYIKFNMLFDVIADKFYNLFSRWI